ncbi:protein spaetzle-like [Diorhabda sublineata]|uniref:protein spaetzle-like n=1 Tax=Diorhabda sublineata TaxID=1163346 RepID=UPI0024E10FA0|nr:protein spaetzle-like [Diorhabda sublineata]
MAKPMNFEVNARNKTIKRSAILFPDDLNFVLDEAPACATDSTYCEEYEDYPEQHLKNLLNWHQMNKNLFGIDVAPLLDTRDDDEEFVCKSRVTTIFPKIAKNTRNAWKIIINQGDNEEYKQGVVVERCLTAGRKCDVIGEKSQYFITACKQKYIYRRLLSLNDVGLPELDSFKLPSACCCSYRRKFDFSFQWRT